VQVVFPPHAERDKPLQGDAAAAFRVVRLAVLLVVRFTAGRRAVVFFAALVFDVDFAFSADFSVAAFCAWATPPAPAPTETKAARAIPNIVRFKKYIG
jgi:hypothetical protein